MSRYQRWGGRRAAGLIVLIVLGMWSLAGAPRPARALEHELDYRSSELVVGIEGDSGLTVAELSAELGATVLGQLRPGTQTYLLGLPPESDPALLAEQLELDLRVEFAEPNYITEAPEANPRGIGGWGGTDPAPLQSQPALATIRLPEALAISQGAGVTVAVIDTGAQLDHPALAAHLAPGGYDFIDGDTDPTDSPDGLDEDGDGLADEAFGHGTHVAGIVHTVAPAARLLIIRALTAEGSGDTFMVARAIDYAVKQGAGVINLSLGTSENAAVLKKAVVAASQAGVVVVAAAGNEGSDTRQYPAAANCAIAVTAVGPDDRRSAFANVGGWVSVAAPGESIFSAFPPDGYAFWSGTSMASPFVAGQAALLRGLRPGLDVRAIGNLIGGSAVGLEATHPHLDGELGDGRIDLAASLRAAAASAELKADHSRISGSCVSPDEI